jgi:hypothetical protein
MLAQLRKLFMIPPSSYIEKLGIFGEGKASIFNFQVLAGLDNSGNYKTAWAPLISHMV